MSDLFALFRQSLAGLRVLVAATLVTGLAYPLVVLGVARVAFPWQAEGSLVTASGEHTTEASEAVGSALRGQAPAVLLQLSLNIHHHMGNEGMRVKMAS